jgi:hypothetical protein
MNNSQGLKRSLSSTSQSINNSTRTVKKPRISTQNQQLSTVSTRKVKRPSKRTPKPKPIQNCYDQSRCNSHWCSVTAPDVVNKFEELKQEILKYTDIVIVGPAGLKPLHDGHLLVIKQAFIEGKRIKDENEAKNVLVLINTSCAGRKKGDGIVIKRGQMFDLWNEFISPTLESYKDIYGIDYNTSFNNDSTLKWLKTGNDKGEININIYSIYSDDNSDQLRRIFGPYTEASAGDPPKFGNVTAIKLPRVTTSGLSGTKAREFLGKNNIYGFKNLTTKIVNSDGYFHALKSGGSRKQKRTKRKYNSVKRK